MATINALRGRLYLLARVPHRDGTPGLAQTRIALRLDDTPTNRRTAAKQLKTLERQLATDSFEWSYWQDDESHGMTWADAIKQLYHKKVVLGRTGESTWEISYMGRLRHVAPATIVTTKTLATALARYRRDSCSYKELYYLLKHIAKIAAVAFPEVSLPTYNLAKPVAVPTDDEIIAWVEQSPNPVRWYFAMMATYGLRPHEIEASIIIEKDYLQVQEEGTKTGFRTVIPVPREWVDRFQLHDRCIRATEPNTKTRADAVSKMLSKELRRRKLPWRAYALRHAYAARLWSKGGSNLDIYTAARLMGHSADQHTKTYRAHIQPHLVAEAAERALLGNR